MKRKVVCESKNIRSRLVRREASEDPSGWPEEEPEYQDYILVFYDQDESAHRNAHEMVLGPDEANKFEVGQLYTLTIG